MLKILFCCSSVGITNRGIESFFREAFDGLSHSEGFSIKLLKGGGPSSQTEKKIWCVPKTSRLARLLGKISGRDSYVIEQWTSFPSVVLEIQEWKPDVIFYSDSNLGFLLFYFRKWIGVSYKLLFSNGGPCHPPFIRRDLIHQVAPLYLQEALRYGEDPARHFLVPYGIKIPDVSILYSDKLALRRLLGLPPDRQIVISVGWIAREHKRMDYVIKEVARMPEPRPFLLLLGAIDEKSPEIIALAEHRLGSGNYTVQSVPYEKVSQYYSAADCFVLASLKEGFGRVYLESLLHGLPTIGHRHPVIEYVLGDVGLLADLSQQGVLAALLRLTLAQPDPIEEKIRRWQSVHDRFSWEELVPHYLTMFRSASRSTSL